MKNILKSILLCSLIIAGITSFVSCKDDVDGDRVPNLKWKAKNYDKSQISFSKSKDGQDVYIEVGDDACSLDLECKQFSAPKFHTPYKDLIFDDKTGPTNPFYTVHTTEWATLEAIGNTIHMEFKSLKESSNSNGFSVLLFTPDDMGPEIHVSRKGYTDVEVEEKSSEPFEMKVRINGEPHSGIVSLDAEGNYVYEDGAFQTLIENVSNDEDMEMLIIENGWIDFFDKSNPEATKAVKKIVRQARPATRAAEAGFELMTSGLGYYAVYSDANFKGNNLNTTLTNYGFCHPRQNLYDMNDKISSVAVAYDGSDANVCSVLTLWDDASFNHGDTARKKHRVSFVASATNRRLTCTNLKTIKCMNSSKSWNDRISSLSFHFGYIDSLLSDL